MDIKPNRNNGDGNNGDGNNGDGPHYFFHNLNTLNYSM